MAKAKKKKNLPVPSKGRNLTKAQKIEIAKSVCNLYQEDNYTLASILQEHGIKSEATWYNWLREIKEIKELYSNSQIIKNQIYRGRLQARARTSLERLVEGYIMELQEVEEVPGEGNKPAIINKRKVKQHYVRPSPTLILAALNNTDRFKRNNDAAFSEDGTNIPTKVEIEIISQGVTPPVTSEDEINEDIF
jgi:transposase-like protein